MTTNTISTPKSSAFSQFIFTHRLAWLMLVMVFGVSADQATKAWAKERLAVAHNSEAGIVYLPADEIVVVPTAFKLIYRENPAAAFSITGSLPEWFRRPFLVSVSFLATIFFVIWYFRIKEADGLLLSSFALIMAGAVGNFIDRIRLGYVVDFLDAHSGFLMSLGIPDAHWPTFNIADSCIVIGAIGVVIRTLWPRHSNLN